MVTSMKLAKTMNTRHTSNPKLVVSSLASWISMCFFERHCNNAGKPTPKLMLMTWLPIAPEIAPCVNPLLERDIALMVSGISAPRATKVAPSVELSIPISVAISAQKYIIQDARTPIHTIEVANTEIALHNDTFSPTSSGFVSTCEVPSPSADCTFFMRVLYA